MNSDSPAADPVPVTDSVLPPASAPPAKSAQDARALLQTLHAEFAVFRDCKPLALRIDAALRERFPEFERKTLRAAMRMHTASTRYLKALERSTDRFDLDGNAVGEVSEEQRTHAASLLKERFAAKAKQQREQRAKQQREEREQLAAQEAERRRNEKLTQLLDRFGR